MDVREAILITNQRMNESLANVYRNNKVNLAELPHKMIIPLLVSSAKHEIGLLREADGHEAGEVACTGGSPSQGGVVGRLRQDKRDRYGRLLEGTVPRWT